MTIIFLSEERIKRNPVRYSVHFNHDENGFWIEAVGISEDAESKKRLAHYLRKAAEFIESDS